MRRRRFAEAIAVGAAVSLLAAGGASSAFEQPETSTLIVEAPDYGHVTTSEAFTYDHNWLDGSNQRQPGFGSVTRCTC